MINEIKKNIAVRMSIKGSLEDKDKELVHQIFLKIRERIIQMDDKNITIHQGICEIEVKLPCAIFFKSSEAISYYTRLGLRIAYDGRGQEYGGGVYVIYLKEVDHNGMLENIITIHTADQWIDVFDKLDCMNFWNDEYMQFYE